MDKKTIEKYLTMYPEIEREIEQLQSELRKTLDQKESFMNLEIYGNQKEIVIETIERITSSITEELENITKAKAIIDQALKDITPVQKEIIECRFWKSKGKPTAWKDVADKLCYHRVHIERLYRDSIDKMIS